MASELIKPSVVIPEATDEAARRAVKTFRRMQPTLSAFARTLSGDQKASVQMDAGSPRTDGKTIYMRPPIELGSTEPHDRAVCDKRDVELQLLCPACMSREGVMVSLYHEIAHIAFDSFAKVNEQQKAEALERAVADSPRKYSEQALKRMRRTVDLSPSFIGLANLVNEFLPIIHNALEDARVNAKAFEARRGTKVMFDAFTMRIFDHGVEQNDRSIKFWREYPLNAQVIVGLFCLGSGYSFDQWFAEPVVEALHDKELHDLVIEVNTSTSAQETYYLSYPILERLRELGFCKQPDKEEPEDDESSDSGTPKEKNSGSSSGESGEEGDASGSDEGDGESRTSGSSRPDTGPFANDLNDDDEDSESEGTDSESGDGGEDSEGEEGDSESKSESRSSDPADNDLGEQYGSGSGEEPAEDERIDTGADSGEGGVRVEGDYDPEPDYGGPDEVIRVLKIFGDHEEKPKTVRASNEEKAKTSAVDRAVVQGIYFETPSRTVYGFHFRRFTDHRNGSDFSVWDGGRYGYAYGQEGDISTPEGVLGPALLKMRRVFSDNARAKEERNKKTGRLNSKVLGSRAFHDDERLFKKKTLPGKKSYFVLIGIDISGSTIGMNLALAKTAAMAQANLCDRMGIDFAVYAHSGQYYAADGDPEGIWGGAGGGSQLWGDIYIIKESSEPWSTDIRKRLENIGSAQANLDGHTIEQYRKICDAHKATDKIILYYTDGKMPAENRDDELEVLMREIQICKKNNHTLLGVGIRTDSPMRHGLDTVQVDSNADIARVVEHLARRLRSKQSA